MILAHHEEFERETRMRDIVTETKPPSVLIGLEHVEQMRERKSQIAAIRVWQQQREAS